MTMAVCFLFYAYLHLVIEKKRPLISDHIKGPLVTASRSPLMKALDRSVLTLAPLITEPVGLQLMKFGIFWSVTVHGSALGCHL